MQDSEVVENTEKAWSELTTRVYDWVDSLVMNLPNFILAVVVLILFIIFAKYSSKLVDKIFRKSSAQDSIRTVSVKVFKVAIILLGFILIAWNIKPQYCSYLNTRRCRCSWFSRRFCTSRHLA